MNRQALAFLSLALAAAVLLAPICAEGSDAAVSDDIHLTLPGSVPDTVEITVGNGASESFTVYVYNDSQDYLVMTTSASSDSGDVSIGVASDTSVLQPAGTSDMGHIATVTVTVSVDRYDESVTETGTVVLSFTDMAGASAPFTVEFAVSIDVDSAYYSADGDNKFLGVYPNTLSGFLGSEIVTAAVTLVAWVVIAFVVSMVAIPLFLRLFANKAEEEDRRRVKKSLTSMIVALIAVLALNQCLAILGVGPEFREGFSTLSDILYIAIGAIFAWILYVFIVKTVIGGMERGTDSFIDSSLVPLFKMIGKIVIAVFAAASILAIFGVDLNGILVSAGVITLGITLGAQNILNQFFSGIVLLSTRPFKKGDFVKIGGEVYIVRRVKLMFTEFDNWDQDQVVTIPNNVVSGGTIVNMTSEDKEARAYVYVKVMYGTDVAKARELMVQAATEHPHVINDGSRSKPSTRLTDVAGNAVELRLAAYVDDFDSAGGYAGELRGRIYELFDQNGIALPPNAIDVYVKEPKSSDE